jgi:ribosomal protein S17E
MKKLFLLIVLSYLVTDFTLSQTPIHTITLNANQAILIDNHIMPIGGFSSGTSYRAAVSGNPTMPMKGAMFMYYDYDREKFAYINSGDGLSFTPGSGSYKLAPFLVDWSYLGDNQGNITINISDGRTITLPGNQAILLDNYPQFPIVGNFENNKTYVAKVTGNPIMPMKGVMVMYVHEGEAYFEYVPIGGSVIFKPGSGSYKFCAFQVDWSYLGDNSGQTKVEIYEVPQTPIHTITLNANQAILIDNHIMPIGGFSSGTSYRAAVSGNPTMPMKGAMFMYYDYDREKFAYINSGDGLSFTPGSGSYKLAPFLVDWSYLGDNQGNITINISDGRTITLPGNQAILLDNYPQFPIVGNFENNKTYVAKVTGNPIMPMKGVMVMYVHEGEAYFEYVPIGGSVIFKPGSGSYKFCAFQVDWSYLGDNSGQTKVEIYQLGTITNIDDKIAEVSKFELFNNYPNPFNPSTVISFSIPQTELVSVKIFDIIGREITTLVNEEKPAGFYEVDFNAADLPSGVYMYRIQAGDYVETKKMLLLK